MSHFITIPVNENGIILDERIKPLLTGAMEEPFDFTDVFIYSHGWWTTATQALDSYNRFSLEFARLVMRLANTPPPGLVHLPVTSLGVGIHWPSMLSDDQDSMLNFAEALSFYTMEKRADTVGEHSVYTILRLLLAGRANAGAPLRIHWLGHSFGCKVVCSALQEILGDQALVDLPENVRFNVVLLQAALDDNDLEVDDIYGGIAAGLPNLRLLVSRSDLDIALQKWYARAHMVNLFKPKLSRVALGAGGPTQAVIDLFGGADPVVAIQPNFQAHEMLALSKRLVLADLTPLHQASNDNVDAFSGHHSDIFHEEIYNMIAGFLFQ